MGIGSVPLYEYWQCVCYAEVPLYGYWHSVCLRFHCMGIGIVCV